jgi:hypothetical protein
MKLDSPLRSDKPLNPLKVEHFWSNSSVPNRVYSQLQIIDLMESLEYPKRTCIVAQRQTILFEEFGSREFLKLQSFKKHEEKIENQQYRKAIQVFKSSEVLPMRAVAFDSSRHEAWSYFSRAVSKFPTKPPKGFQKCVRVGVGVDFAKRPTPAHASLANRHSRESHTT